MKDKIKKIPILSELLLLIQFFTRIPVNINLDYGDDNFKRASYLMNILSLIIFIPLILTYELCKIIGINYEISSMIIMIFWIIITGAFHYDGLADTCDGLFSGRHKERILEIMKDSRIGSYGTIATIIDILFKFIILKSLLYYGNENLILLILMGGKLSLNLCAYLGKSAKKESSGNYFINNANIISSIINILITTLMALYFNKLEKALIFIAFISIINFLFIKYANKKIGGIVGDNLGFLNEIGEILFGIILLMN